jgi:hypothetical protein
MKVIGKWSKSLGSIHVRLPKYRKVGGKYLEYNTKYLGGKEEPFPTDLVGRDLSKEFGKKIILIATGTRGGNVVEDE